MADYRWVYYLDIVACVARFLPMNEVVPPGKGRGSLFNTCRHLMKTYRNHSFWCRMVPKDVDPSPATYIQKYAYLVFEYRSTNFLSEGGVLSSSGLAEALDLATPITRGVQVNFYFKLLTNMQNVRIGVAPRESFLLDNRSMNNIECDGAMMYRLGGARKYVGGKGWSGECGYGTPDGAKRDAIIGVHVDALNEQLSYSLNGKSLGIAFTARDLAPGGFFRKGTLYPAIDGLTSSEQMVATYMPFDSEKHYLPPRYLDPDRVFVRLSLRPKDCLSPVPMSPGQFLDSQSQARCNSQGRGQSHSE
eukprot:TRINITY_DN9635_c1_g1_i2.p1 TRINITY_DN9635_c1_g1~~TRINITY_DN9635_c1_g1_i2.p1  ORF type:complete len:304 (-),score=25.50 TRINITY_DN9635_c1_g1_i2:419-1330(-)